MFKLPRKVLVNVSIIACALFLVSNFFSCLKNSTQKIFKPHLSVLDLIKREIGGIVFYHRNMVSADKFKNEVDLLRLRLFDLREISQENNRLKDLLNFKQKSPLRLVAARIIARSPDNWSKSAVIDKGRYNGIKKGMVVISPRGLVGSVVESLDNASKVLLINDPNLGISSIVQRSRQEGLVNGTLGTNLIMRYLPDDAQITVGDLVVTSELSQLYPKGLLIGKVVNIGREFSGLNRYAIIKPAVDLANIEEVLIILP